MSAMALLARGSGASEVAFTVETVKKKINCVKQFLQRVGSK